MTVQCSMVMTSITFMATRWFAASGDGRVNPAGSQNQVVGVVTGLADGRPAAFE